MACACFVGPLPASKLEKLPDSLSPSQHPTGVWVLHQCCSCHLGVIAHYVVCRRLDALAFAESNGEEEANARNTEIGWYKKSSEDFTFKAIHDKNGTCNPNGIRSSSPMTGRLRCARLWVSQKINRVHKTLPTTWFRRTLSLSYSAALPSELITLNWSSKTLE
ncbi:hypothetical protein B296_00027529 [Ensete ventricosum]|uniref:Uncharacterized protein n=1 Tax=Ensete ventricosum TaxID=4639 RepID=A0A426YEX3_ENSVE|nr:hypothetical protein B296_00027529 [Ensete ventricosum]